MAFALPYPNMNFVPLDILTAQQQNQLVANIQALADEHKITSANVTPSTNYTIHSTYGCKVYKQGSMVYFVGTLTMGADVNTATNTTVCTIPSAYRTTNYHYGLCSKTGNNIFRYINATSGTITVQALQGSNGDNIFFAEYWMLN